jgi:hypothetical protein
VVTRLLSAALVLTAAVPSLAQEIPPTGDHQRANESFFGPIMFLLVLVPIVITAVLAIKRGRNRKSRLEEWDDSTFQEQVVEAQMPVLVHLALDWNITNRAALAQTEILAYYNRGAVKVGLLKVDECPETLERFPGLEPPAYVLFYGGKKLFHRPGLWQADDLQQHIDRALAEQGF